MALCHSQVSLMLRNDDDDGGADGSGNGNDLTRG
jgi:hypothetical protein